MQASKLRRGPNFCLAGQGWTVLVFLAIVVSYVAFFPVLHGTVTTSSRLELRLTDNVSKVHARQLQQKPPVNTAKSKSNSRSAEKPTTGRLTSTSTRAKSTTANPTPAGSHKAAGAAAKPKVDPCPAVTKQLKSILKPSPVTSCRKDQHAAPISKILQFPITLVTAYFVIPSKRPSRVYMSWLDNFLVKIKTPVSFFTDCKTAQTMPRVVESFKKRERAFPARLAVTITGLEDTPMARRLGPVLKKQEARDGERSVGHNYLLYLAWLMKPEAVMSAIEQNQFCSEWFLWVDAGAFRKSYHNMVNWPSTERFSHIPKDRALFELVFAFPAMDKIMPLKANEDFTAFLKRKRGLIYSNHLAGGFIGLNVRDAAHLRFYNALNKMYDKLVSMNQMIVKDQAVFHALFLSNPKLFALIHGNDACGDVWFHAQAWLADPKEYPCSKLDGLNLI